MPLGKKFVPNLKMKLCVFRSNYVPPIPIEAVVKETIDRIVLSGKDPIDGS